MTDASTDSDKVVAAKVPFAELCGLLEKLSKTQGNDKKKRVLGDFVDSWRRLHNETHTDDADTTVRNRVLCSVRPQPSSPTPWSQN